MYRNIEMYVKLNYYFVNWSIRMGTKRHPYLVGTMLISLLIQAWANGPAEESFVGIV
jgi:hypothetical protein